MPEDDFGNLLQGRAETSGIFIALVIGIFGLLTLLQDAVTYSVTWYLLSIAYAFVMIVTYFAFSNWVHQVLIAFFYKKININDSVKKELELKIEAIREKSRLMKWALYSYSVNDDERRMRRFIESVLVIFVVLGIALWAVIAFKA